ncbi:MAG: maleylacetoacetate isomerase [Litorivicinus sp.]
MILYDYWRSSASYRVRIALSLKGLSYQKVAVNLLESEHLAAEHLGRNALGRVPVLVDGDLTLTQSGAILEYLNGLCGPDLWPEDRIKCRELVDLIACDIHPICNLGTVKAVCETAGRNVKVEWMVRAMQSGLDALEVLCPAPVGGWAFGHPSMFEVYLVPQMYNASRWGMDLTQWPKLSEINSVAVDLDEFRFAAPVGA